MQVNIQINLHINFQWRFHDSWSRQTAKTFSCVTSFPCTGSQILLYCFGRHCGLWQPTLFQLYTLFRLRESHHHDSQTWSIWLKFGIESWKWVRIRTDKHSNTHDCWNFEIFASAHAFEIRRLGCRGVFRLFARTPRTFARNREWKWTEKKVTSGVPPGPKAACLIFVRDVLSKLAMA